MRRVCVQGLGFVGAAMAAAVAQARTADGAPTFDVVGLDLPNAAGLARVNAINAGNFPFDSSDLLLSEAVKRGHEAGNLHASTDPAEYENCAVVVVDVHLDVDFAAKPPQAKFGSFLAAVRTLAERVSPGTLVLIETTVPPGTTEKVVVPEIEKGLKARGLDPQSVLVAHSYERVMPGKDYLASITNFWRVYSGHTDAAADACERFLKEIVNTRKYPLTRLKRTADSETAKLMENSFRAVNIAFVNEWGRFAEAAGVDLGSVIQAIRVRPTHQNIMRPGFGVGGYCLTKDPLLIGIGARDLFGFSDARFPFCEAAVATNSEMPRATVAMLRKTLGDLSGKRLLLFGATYREDVADTRYSPSGPFVAWAEAEGAVVDIHDPMVNEIEEGGYAVMRSLPPAQNYDAAVFAVGHEMYRKMQPKDWLGNAHPAIVDANMVLSAQQITAFRDSGCVVKAIGRGDL